jgi:two-component system, cell cycle sensor histidine kinase and response regulator CckA
LSRNKYVNFFDFSPIPYFTLNKDGIIKEVNLIASKMLGTDRNKLIGKLFINYVTLDERVVYNLFLKKLFTTQINISCELKVINKVKHVFNVRLDGLELEDALQTEQKCLIAIIDLTGYKKIVNS